MTNLIDGEISHAIVLWSGKGLSSYPVRDEEAIFREFGHELGQTLLPRILSLEAEFYDSKAHVEAVDLVQMGMRAASEFSARHPEIGKAAIDALAWCYTYDYK
ncbi:hypothetical protein ACTJI8_00695 [Microbacterium sp. 22303]|uniref:hypothetical protein n=1 Tax=Microbacterium sp. 22303 TaxID=3453905 RepID=UPI003F83845A